MIFTILLHPRVASQLEKMDADLRNRLKSALKELRESPESSGERLHPSDYWKMRIGDYRAVYQIEASSKSVIIILVDRRSKVYDDFERML
ncbi:MAG: type II toxin-antitoxin system RelE family toxin [Nitrososphaerales archaeon]